MLVDSHAHLDMAQFDADRDDVIRRAESAGVNLILTVATANPEHDSIEKTLSLIERHDWFYGAIGVHPHDARTVDEAYLSRMREQARHPKIRLWGEIGLDYFYDHSPRERQKEVFVAQLEIARELGLPVVIHCRDAWPEAIALLERRGFAKNAGILHSFTGTPDQAHRCLELGFLISFSGMITFKNAAQLRETAKSVPLESTLIETDCPYLAPAPHRGRRNEPSFVIEVARALSQLHNVALEQAARQTTENFCRVAGLPIPEPA
jgi:TatD DNase family protein